jgi:hypothetical protein
MPLFSGRGRAPVRFRRQAVALGRGRIDRLHSEIVFHGEGTRTRDVYAASEPVTNVVFASYTFAFLVDMPPPVPRCRQPGVIFAQLLRYLHDGSDCFRLERLPGGTCTHWKAPPLHGAHPKRTSLI